MLIHEGLIAKRQEHKYYDDIKETNKVDLASKNEDSYNV